MSVMNTNSHLGYEVFNGLAPAKKPRAMRIAIDFGVYNPYVFDLVLAQEKDQLEWVQAIYCDNSANPNAFSITSGTTNQTLTWPAYSQGYLPCLCGNPPKFSAASVGSPIVRIHLLNFPVPAMIWPANDTYVIQGGTTGTDFSANKPALLANLIATMPVNPARANFEVQNQSGGTIQAVLDDGAGGNISIVLLSSGGVAGSMGADLSDNTFKGRVRIYAASANDQVLMRQT